jgi:hypothetical protein
MGFRGGEGRVASKSVSQSSVEAYSQLIDLNYKLISH